MINLKAPDVNPICMEIDKMFNLSDVFVYFGLQKMCTNV